MLCCVGVILATECPEKIEKSDGYREDSVYDVLKVQERANPNQCLILTNAITSCLNQRNRR